MKTATKFRFKMNRPTGEWRVFNTTFCDIFLDKNLVGGIYEDRLVDFPVSVRFMVMKNKEDLAKPNNNTNCEWKWITLKQRYKTFDEAKQYINLNFNIITSSFNLRTYED